jgi:hypothetical protein
MHETARRALALLGGGRLEEQDVRDDPELEARYLFEIPVLLADGRELARHRVSEAELLRLLEAL